MLRFLLLALYTLLLFSCEQQPQDKQKPLGKEVAQLQPLPDVEIQPVKLLQEPIEAVLVETAAEAIPTWRKYAKAKPTLVLLQKNPLLQQIPMAEQDQVRQLTMNGVREDFARKANTISAAATMYPNMSLSTALEQGFFSRVVWVLPMSPAAELSLESFLQKMLSMGDLTQAEASTFSANEDGFSGKVRGIPFFVTTLKNLPTIKNPTVIHLDMSFFATNYLNEIRTPLYKYSRETLSKLQALELQAFAITICQANLFGGISLRTRFLGKHIQGIIQNPDRLRVKLDKTNSLRNEALYLENFFRKNEVLSLNQKLVEIAPEDPAAHYDLYQTLRQHQQTNLALSHLKKAADLDPVYAMEYLTLANLGVDKRLASGTIDMLKNAQIYFPDNIFIKLNLAQIYAETGNHADSVKILNELKQLHWTPTYHQRIREQIETLLSQEQAQAEEKTRSNRPKSATEVH